jgi:hypothetical protein
MTNRNENKSKAISTEKKILLMIVFLFIFKFSNVFLSELVLLLFEGRRKKKAS